MILENGTVLTGDPRLPRSRALAIAGDRVAGGVDVREGDRSQVSDERIDLDGRCVAPGFTDAHIHFLEWSLSLQQLELRGTPTREAAIAKVAEAAPTGEGWLLGGGWHAGHWDREPTRADLDAVAAGRPVLLWAHDHHTAWVSTAALEQAPLPDLEVVERDARGQPTGLLREHAAWTFAGAVPLPPHDRLDEIVRAGVRQAHRLGVTGIHDYQRPAGLATWQRLHADRRLDLRVWASLPYERLDEALGLELRTGLGDEWLRIGPVKGFADGTLGSRTASMLQPFEDAGLGLALLGTEELTDAVRRASLGGLDIAVHAIGDAANRTVLDALEATADVWQPAGRRPRIEHAQVLDPADLPRFAALGVTASMQPSHAPTDRDGAFTAWGPARTANAYAWGALQRSGALLAFGSDAPIEPVDPLGGVQAAVTRDWPVEQALSAEDALAGFWAGAAYARHADRRSGRLLPGYDADLVVLDRDPLTCPPDEIGRIEVVGTMIGGRWVHGAPPW
jgi:predicted amidohydrolase YtcJ